MRRLGSNYVLDQRIGRGAQGEVWRGRSVSDHQEDGLGPERTQQDVLAFKVLRADLVEDEGLVGRFVKERTTLTRIRSPYVVNIRDFVIEGTTFAIVMDYVPGGDLRGKLASDGPLPPAEVARIGAHVARGLMAVHAAGVVHRDVKPANILLDSSTDPATPRVVDFGIARIHNAVGTDHLTGILGTPLYMAPEILLGEVPRPASDLYSLGIVLYQSCCGVTPFVGDPGQLLGQHVGRLPGRPEGIPDSLWGILSLLLAKRPEQRPTAQQVAHDLEKVRPSLEGLLPAPRIATPPASAPSSDSLAFGGGVLPPRQRGPDPHRGIRRLSPLPRRGHGYSGGPALEPPPISILPTRRPHAASGQSGQYRLIQPSGGYPPPRRRRRGWKIAVAAVLAVALTGTGVLAVRHFLFNGPDVPGDAVAALPAGKGFSERLRLPNGYRQYVSPDGGMLAVESGKWAVYRLDDTKSEPVWKGDCYAHMSGFWDNSHFLCANSDKRELISPNGAISTPPGPSDSRLKGATADRTVLTAAYTGDLLALDRNGKEVWRAYGKFSSDVIVTESFVLAVDKDADTVQVFSTSTGKKLASSSFGGSDKTLEEDPHPAGFGVDAGNKAFYQIQDGKYTIWDVEGRRKETGTTKASSSNWVASTSVSPKELAGIFKKVDTDSVNIIRGKEKTIKASISNSQCKVRVGGKTMEVPAPASEDSCSISVFGLTGDDSAILVGSRTDSDKSVYYDKGGVVAAYSLKDGSMLWKATGRFSRALGDNRIMLVEGLSSSGNIVVGTVNDG